MAKSYRKINYSLRPAKAVERKMLVEAFRRLSEFYSIESFQYIGFGSLYFTDFILVHKALNIKNMVCIEREVSDEKRFNFNKPFSCVKLLLGESTVILPTLNWTAPTITWLDYDGSLSPSVLADVGIVCASAQPGSVLLVTLNAEPAEYDLYNEDGQPRKPNRLDQLRGEIGPTKVPAGLSETDLAGQGTGTVFARIISNEISEQLLARNGGLLEHNHILYQQLFNFRYSDGARMLTIGGILYSEAQHGALLKCQFDRLPFVRTGAEAYHIDVPNLTFREIRQVEKQLPAAKLKTLTSDGIPESDVRKYMQLYRYFPTFAETEV